MYRKMQPRYSIGVLFMLTLTVVFDICNGFNIAPSQPRYIDSEELNYDETVYFGYSFAIRSMSPPNPPMVNFLIGSPKSRDPSSSETVVPFQTAKAGNLVTCPFSFSDSSGGCVSSRPPPVNQTAEPNIITSGESLGLEVVSGTNSDRITACAPTRTNNCSSGAIVYGACYVSNDFGQTWENEARQPEASCPIDHIDLMFVLDGSGSVISDDPMNFERVKDWVKDVAKKFNLDGFANVGVIQYSHYDETRPLHDQLYLVTEIGLGQYNNQKDFQRGVDNIELQGFTTYTAHALNRTVLDFQMSPRFNDSATRKVLILLTDGRSNDRDFLMQSSAYARSLGITIFAVGVAGYSERELQIIANGEVGNNDRVFGLENFSDLEQIVVGLQRSIAGVLEGSLQNSTNELQQSETGLSGAQSDVSYRI